MTCAYRDEYRKLSIPLGDIVKRSCVLDNQILGLKFLFFFFLRNDYNHIK